MTTSARLCIDCARPLTAATPEPAERIRCTCGLLYSIELVEHADPELWDRARTERLFLRDGDTLIMTTPLEAIRGWRQ